MTAGKSEMYDESGMPRFFDALLTGVRSLTLRGLSRLNVTRQDNT